MNTPNFPRLRSGRVTLEPFAETLLSERYAAWLNDPEVVRYSENRHHHHTVESCRDYWKSVIGAGHLLWAVLWNEDEGRHIGNVTAYVDRPNLVADLAIVIGDRGAWGRRLGREAWALAQDWLLGPGGMRKVTAGTMAANVAMRKVMNDTGMKEEGRLFRQYLLDGESQDKILAAKYRSV